MHLRGYNERSKESQSCSCSFYFCPFHCWNIILIFLFWDILISLIFSKSCAIILSFFIIRYAYRTNDTPSRHDQTNYVQEIKYTLHRIAFPFVDLDLHHFNNCLSQKSENANQCYYMFTLE